MSTEMLIEPDLRAQLFRIERLDRVWHVLQTKCRGEKALSVELSAMGLANVLPVVCQERYFGRRRAIVEIPIFPGLVFLEGTDADLELACQTMRVLQTIKVTDQESFAWTLVNLLKLAQRHVELTACPPLACGPRVEVRSGPLSGIQGLVDNRGDRLVFQVEGFCAAAVGVKLVRQTLVQVV